MSDQQFSPQTINNDDDSLTLRQKARLNFDLMRLAFGALGSSIFDALKTISDSIIKPALRGGFNVGDIRYFGTLQNAVNAIPSTTNYTLYITNQQTLTGSLTIPSNIAIEILDGGKISGPYTLTIKGPFRSFLGQCFGTDITVKFGTDSVTEFIPQWWGAKGDNSTVDTTAIQSCYNSAKASVSVGSGTGGAVVYFPAGIYKSGAILFDTPFVSIRGDGKTASEIRTTGSGTSFVKFYGGAVVGGPENFDCFIKDLKISYGAGTWTQLLHLQNCSDIDISRVWVEGSTTQVTYTVLTESALVFNIDECVIRGASLDALRIIKLNTGVADGNAYPNAVTVMRTAIKEGSRWGLHYSDGEGLFVSTCDFSVNGNTSDINHGAVYIDAAGAEVGAGLCATIENCRFESTTGIQVKIGKHAFAPGGTLIKACNAGGGLYGVYADVTAPDRGRVIVLDSGFIGATGKDYYIANDMNATILRCSGITATFTASTIAIPTPQDGSQSQISAGWLAYTPGDINGNASTANVSTRSPIYTVTNSLPTTLNTLTGCKDGNTITLYGVNNNTTLKHRATGVGVADEIDCPGAVDVTLHVGEILTFIRIAGHWYPTMPQILNTTSAPRFGGLILSTTAPTQIIYSDSGNSLKSESNFVWDETTHTLNLGGEVATANYPVNAFGKIASVGNAGGVYQFGVGQPSNLAAGNTEYVVLAHDGSSEAYLSVLQSGLGAYRNFSIRTSNITRFSITTAGAASFAGTLGVTGVATFTLAPVFSSGTASQTMELDGSKALTTVAITGTGNYVKSASPTFTGTVVIAAATFSSTITSSSDFIFTAGNRNVYFNTAAGFDTGRLTITAGGAANGDVTRASYISLRGNNNGLAGAIQYVVGNVTGGQHLFYSGNSILAALIDESQNLNIAGNVAVTAGGNTTGKLLFGSAAAIGVYFGSGAPTVSAGKGSLYLRTDGTGTTDRAYINTNGTTTWTALTTSA